MGKIKQGILGGFSGAVGPVVGTSWKGRAVVKAKPLSVANPKTAGQVSQRTSFSGVSKIVSQILTSVIRPLYNPTAGNISGANQFSSINKLMFDGVGDFDFSQASIGNGSLIHNQVESIGVELSTQKLSFDFTPDDGGDAARLDDEIVAWAYEPISGTVWVGKSGKPRSQAQINLSKFKAGSDLSSQLQITAFIGFVSADGRLTSVLASGFQAVVDFDA